MSVVRIYDAGMGDCIAFRDGVSTRFILGTGDSESYARYYHDQGGSGFGAALDHALVVQEGPALVIAGDIDPSTLGGLRAWVADIFQRHRKQKRAPWEIAGEEVREIWCNVPPQDIALARLARLPVLQNEINYTQTRRMTGDGLPDVIADTPIQVASGDGETELSPKGALHLFTVRQQQIQGLFGVAQGADLADQLMSGEVFQAFGEGLVNLPELLQQAFPGRTAFLHALSKGNCQLEVPAEAPTEQTLPGLQVPAAEPQELISLHLRLGKTVSVYVEMLGASDDAETGPSDRLTRKFWSGFSMEQAIASETICKLQQLMAPLPWKSGEETRITVRFYVWSGTLATRLMKSLRPCRSVHEVLGEFLGTVGRSPGMDLERREQLAILRIILGLVRWDGIAERLNLYKALEMAGVPFMGRTPESYVSPGQHPPIPRTRALLIAPRVEEFALIRSQWHSYASSLQPKARFEAALLAALAAPGLLPWTPDGRVHSPLDLGIWVYEAGDHSSVILSGGAQHRSVMSGMNQLIAERSLPAARTFYYQIPDHGSRFGTDPATDGDVLPRELLSLDKRISRAFTTGCVPDAPDPEVLAFHQRGARLVTDSAALLRERGLSQYDLRLR